MAHLETEWNCPECQNTTTNYSLKIIPTGKDAPYPRYNIQIKEYCSSCGRYRRFAPQSTILIKRFNDRLKTISLPKKGRDTYE